MEDQLIVFIFSLRAQVQQFKDTAKFFSSYGSRPCLFPRGICVDPEHNPLKCAEQVLALNLWT